jgi:hypothetical protein
LQGPVTAAGPGAHAHHHHLSVAVEDGARNCLKGVKDLTSDNDVVVVLTQLIDVVLITPRRAHEEAPETTLQVSQQRLDIDSEDYRRTSCPTLILT